MFYLAFLGSLCVGAEIKRSYGPCGNNPLTDIVSEVQELDMSFSEILQILEADPEAWGQLLRVMHQYHDCITTKDVRGKRTRGGKRARGMSLTTDGQSRVMKALHMLANKTTW